MNIRTPGHLLEFQNDPTENPARHDNIQFTIEFETNQQIPFLDVSIKRLDIVQLLRDKIVRFLIKASNLAGLLTSIRQTFPDMEPCQILFQNHGMRMSKIWHTRPLHGNEADAKYHFF